LLDALIEAVRREERARSGVLGLLERAVRG
jgi:hypothetical protein